MLKTLGKYLLIGLLLLVIAAGGFYFGSRYSLKKANRYDLKKLNTTLRLIDNYYVDSVSVDSLVEGVVPQLLNELDPHSSYFTPKQQEEDKASMEGKFFGIGVTFNTIIDTAVVVSVIPNGPSDLVGIKAGDRIIKVNGMPISGKSFTADSIRTLLKGPDKSKVNLSIYRPMERKNLAIQVIRGEVDVRQTQAVFMINDSLGCIKIPRFSMGVHEDFLKGYASLLSQGLKGIVLDLRDNPGGLMHAALAISNEFLPAKRMIIYTQGRSEPKQVIYSDGAGTIKTLPVYVLINESSASSSEIVAGALQDNDRAVIIGRRSFGKGLVQKAFDFPDGSSIHLTIARYYTPSGRSIQREYKLGGDEAYSTDWYRRLISGEMYHADSMQLDTTQVYRTYEGRPVYGGGGIVPDIFIPRDTVGFTSYYGEVVSKGLVQKYGFIYADKYRNILSKLRDGMDCYAFLKNQRIVWQFAQWAATQGVRQKNYLIYLSHDLLLRNLSMLIVSNIFGEDEAAKVDSQSDTMILKAAELFATGVASPTEIPPISIELPKADADSIH